jgi:hypothetical protein
MNPATGEPMRYEAASPTNEPSRPASHQSSPPQGQTSAQEVPALSPPPPSRPTTPEVHRNSPPSSEDEVDNTPPGEGWFRSQPGIHTMRLMIPPHHEASDDELVDAKYLRFTVNYDGEPTIEATMGRAQPHYALPIMASPVEGRRTPPLNDEEDLAFLAKTHMMNSALNRALEGLGDYGVYADVIQLRNGRRRVNELDRQNGYIENLKTFARQQRLRYEHQRWEHAERQKEVRTRLIRANTSGRLQALIREDPELSKRKREHEQAKPYRL